MIIRPTDITAIPGTSITITFPATVTTPDFGQIFTFAMTESLPPITGTEEVIISVGASTYPLVDNNGLLVTGQMLRRPQPMNCCQMTSAVYRIQFGAAGTESVFFARRGFRQRRTTVNVATPPTP